jgi:hypothetical protein
VFSKFGAALLPAIAAISTRFKSMPFKIAGLNASTFTMSKRGKPPCGPVHASRSGLPVCFAVAARASDVMVLPATWASATSAADWRNERLCMKVPKGLLGAGWRFGDYWLLDLRHMNG